MTTLSFLHEPGVLSNLRSRYTSNAIYTNTGTILIAVNPFSQLPHLYTPQLLHSYMSRPAEELPPHVFATACSAYRQMLRDKCGQAILVSATSCLSATIRNPGLCSNTVGDSHSRSSQSEACTTP